MTANTSEASTTASTPAPDTSPSSKTGRAQSAQPVLEKLFEEIAPRYMDRPGGYTRMYKLGPRKGDAAEMVLLELVDREEA